MQLWLIIHFQKQLASTTYKQGVDQHMQKDNSNDLSPNFEQSIQNINRGATSDLHTNKAIKDCFKQCFAKYINGSIHAPSTIIPIELSSDADSDQSSHQHNHPKGQIATKRNQQSSSSSSSQSRSSSVESQKQKININKGQSKKKQRSFKKIEHQRRIIKILNKIKPEAVQQIPTKPPTPQTGNHQVINRQPNFNIHRKNSDSQLQTNKILGVNFDAQPNQSTNQVPEWKKISESKRFLSRRLAKEDKINLGVYTLQEVVTFAFNEGIINKLLYYEFTITYMDKKQSEFVHCFVDQQIEKWDFKNHKIVLADHRRLTSLLTKLKPTVYTLNNPQSLDSDMSEFLKGIYDLQEEKYERMMDYIDKVSNNIWWLPLKIKYFTSSLIDQFTPQNHSLDVSMGNMKNKKQSYQQNNESNSEENIPKQRSKLMRQNIMSSAEKNGSGEQNENSGYFKSRIYQLTKPQKVIRKCQNESSSKVKKILSNLKKLQKQKHQNKFILQPLDDSPHCPSKKYELKPILKQK